MFNKIPVSIHLESASGRSTKQLFYISTKPIKIAYCMWKWPATLLNLNFSLLNLKLGFSNANFKIFRVYNLKRATKSYFTHYCFVVIVLFNIAYVGLHFSTSSFRKLVFRLFVLSWWRKIYVIMLCNFDMQFCPDSFVLTLYKDSPFYK